MFHETTIVEINYVSDGIAILINFDGVSRAMTAKNLQKVC